MIYKTETETGYAAKKPLLIEEKAAKFLVWIDFGHQMCGLKMRVLANGPCQNNKNNSTRLNKKSCFWKLGAKGRD